MEKHIVIHAQDKSELNEITSHLSFLYMEMNPDTMYTGF